MGSLVKFILKNIFIRLLGDKQYDDGTGSNSSSERRYPERTG